MAGQDPSTHRRWGPEQALDVARVLFTTHDRDLVLSYLVDKLIGNLHVQRGFVIFTHGNAGLEFAVAHNFSREEIERPDSEVSSTIVLDVARRRLPVLIEDAAVHPLLKDQTSVIQKGIRSVMCTPMIAQGELMGVIYVDNLSEGGKFGRPDLDMLALIGSYASAALYNARLVEGLGGEGHEQRSEAEKAAAVGQMAAEVVHDFNNVLTAIQGRLQIMQKKGAQELFGEEINAATDALEWGKQLIKEVSRLAEASAPFKSSRVDLAEVAREALALESYCFDAEPGKYEVEVDLPDSLVVTGAETQLKEMVINLVRNALEAMVDGGRLALSLEPQGKFCALAVSDTGCGIPQEAKDRIFDLFFTTKRNVGRGLGLSPSSAVWGKMTDFSSFLWRF